LATTDPWLKILCPCPSHLADWPLTIVKKNKNLKLIGVDLGGTNVRAGLIVQNKLVALEKNPTHGHAKANVVVEEICKTIAAVFRPGVAGIGVGVPTIVDVKKGIVFSANNIPSWHMVPLKKMLEKRFHVPVYVNNDANCFALGELHFGEARGYKNIVGIICGTGIGSGVVINGKLYSGTNCGAGEIGNTTYLEKDFEHYCSGRFFPREFGIDAYTAEQRADAGDPKAKKMFAAYADHFAEMIMMVLYAYDPEIIVLGGGVNQALRHFEKPVWKKLRAQFHFQSSLKHLKIVLSKNKHVAVLAAASLCLDTE
jgi:glucokinase